MILNILRISASSFLQMFLNMIVSIGSSFVISHSHNINRQHKSLPCRCPGRQESNIISKNDLKQSCTHTTLYYRRYCTDNKVFPCMILYSIQNSSSSPFLSLEYVLRMFFKSNVNKNVVVVVVVVQFWTFKKKGFAKKGERVSF